MTEFVIVLTTLPVEADADAIVTALVEERLVACANVLPAMQSVYRWQGHVEKAEERQVVMKTTSAQVPPLQSRLQTLHPYDVPEFLVLAVAGGAEAYLRWMADSTNGRA